MGAKKVVLFANTTLLDQYGFIHIDGFLCVSECYLRLIRSF